MKRAELISPGKPLKIYKAAIPVAPEQGCLIKTTFSGVCHTDLHLIDDKFYLGHGSNISISNTIEKRGFDPFESRVLGHNIAGVVEKFGENADRAGLEKGDKVAVFPWIGCGRCSACNLGQPLECERDVASTCTIGFGDRPGGFSTHVQVPSCSFLVKIPDNIDGATGCMLGGSALSSFSALNKARPAISNALKKFDSANLLIIGAGGLGMWATILAKIIFIDQAVKVTVADIDETALENVKKLGADRVVNWDQRNDLTTSARLTTRNGSDKMDAVIDLCGRHITCNIGIQCLRKKGIIIIVGLMGGAFTFPLPDIVLPCITITGTMGGDMDELKELIQLVSQNDIKYKAIEEYKLENINRAIERLRGGKINGRVIIKF